MSVDLFLRDGEIKVPAEYAEFERTKKIHHALLMDFLKNHNKTADGEAAVLEAKRVFLDAETLARKAFYAV
jgi:hypothetical protein